MKSSRSADQLTIGALAGRFGLATHVLRHWETVGLLAPERGPDGRRRYGEDDLFRVALILQGKELGFGLDRIWQVLDPDPTARRALLVEHRDALRQRIAEARAAEAAVEHAIDCTHGDFLRCPVMRQAIEARIPPKPG